MERREKDLTALGTSTFFARTLSDMGREGASTVVAERLTVKSARQILFLKPREIDWIEAADYYACLHVGTRTHLLRRSMKELEQDLDPSVVYRIHRSAPNAAEFLVAGAAEDPAEEQAISLRSIPLRRFLKGKCGPRE